MQRKLVVSSSPFLRNPKASTRGIMLDVIIALLPSALAAVWYFGAPALSVMVISVLFAVLSEWAYERMTHQKSTIGDLSAVVTGLLLAFNLPAGVPWWMPAIGSVIAIVLVKQIFGGIGQNFINPALAARTILMLSWASLISTTVAPNAGQLFGLGAPVLDAIGTATPLAQGEQGYSLWQVFSGNIPGMLGETCKITLLLGGVYLIVRRVIDWRIPVSFLAAALLLYWIDTGVLYSVASGEENAIYQLCSGGLLLGAFFMATDYVTSPVSKVGRVIMGVGCALILYVIRVFNAGYPEGCSFAILFMNVMTPLIDKLTLRKPFGYTNPPKAVKAEAGKGEAKA